MEKDEFSFSKDKSRKDGLFYICKDCHKQSQQRWLKNNPDKRAAAVDRYHETHIEEEKEYRILNSVKISDRVKSYTKNNRRLINDKIKIKRRNPVIKLRHNISSLVRFYIKGTKNGSITTYINGVQIGTPFTWTQYTGQAPTPGS